MPIPERKRAYIHIGLAKTGSTSIQYAMAMGRQALLEQGYFFPTSGTPDRASGHHCLAWALCNSPRLQEQCGGFTMHDFRSALEESGNLELIISSEELSNLAYSYKKIRHLINFFSNYELFLIAYVREQAEFFNAFWLELLSDLDYKGDIGVFVDDRMLETRYNYNNWFKLWKEFLGPHLIIRPFDREWLCNSNVVDDFCNTIGIDGSPLRRSDGWKNRSLNAMQVAATIGLLTKLQGLGINYRALSGDSKASVKGVLSHVIRVPELLGGENYWGIDSERLQRIHQHYRDANALFFREHLGEGQTFSALDRASPSTALHYTDLDVDLREKLESTFAEKIRRLPVAHLSTSENNGADTPR